MWIQTSNLVTPFPPPLPRPRLCPPKLIAEVSKTTNYEFFLDAAQKCNTLPQLSATVAS